jgi:hypothetical protein
MVTADRGTKLRRGKRQVGLPCGLTRHFRGNEMAAKTTSPTTKRKASGAKSKGNSNAGPPVVSTSARTVVARNLVNMVVVMAGSGAVLLGLLTARHFQIAQF